jgi:CBS domain-containing protein
MSKVRKVDKARPDVRCFASTVRSGYSGIVSDQLDTEQVEIAVFLGRHCPFRELPKQAVDDLARQVKVVNFRAGAAILNLSDPIHDLYVIRKGAVETFRRSGELYNRLGEGDVFGQISLMMGQRVRFPVTAMDDTRVYLVPFALYRQYCDRYESFGDFFETGDGTLLQKTVASEQYGNDLTTVKVHEILTRPAVSIAQNTSIRDAARVMSEHQLSSLLISDNDPGEPALSAIAGIITDWDLRERVIAGGVSIENPVGEVMSPVEITLDHNAYVYEAVLLMLRQNMHHLPIMRRAEALGVLTLTDLLQHEAQGSILLLRNIFSVATLDELSDQAALASDAFVRMVKEDANSHMIGSAMAVIGRSFKQRLLQMAEDRLGPPPVPYCLLALGSMARDEQLLHTDQDNALVLDDAYDAGDHGEYFDNLARFVSDGLAQCGYRYCDGGIMATNPLWRLTRSQWRECFSGWVDKPDPQALLNSSIFFDLDGVAGKTAWADELKQFVAAKTRGNRLFLASMARNAIKRTPPLGFFRAFVLEKDGRYKDSMNLKRRGTAPLTDLIRVHALATGSGSVNSFERLDDIMGSGILPKGKGTELSDALEYISMVRIRNQARQAEQGNEVNNNIRPEDLGPFERRNLKEAFQVLSSAQNFLKYRYNSNIPLN